MLEKQPSSGIDAVDYVQDNNNDPFICLDFFPPLVFSVLEFYLELPLYLFVRKNAL